jgi:hypothetical protein
MRQTPKHSNRTGKAAGSVGPNSGLTQPSYLWGTSDSNPGVLWDIASHPTAASLLRHMQQAVASSDIRISADFEDDRAQKAAEILNDLFDDNIGVSDYASVVFYDLIAYGFHLSELVLQPTGEIEMYRIASYNIREWKTDDLDNLESVEVTSSQGGVPVHLQKENLVWFGLNNPLGIYWGYNSPLRGVAPFYTIAQSQLIVDPDIRRKAAPLIYVQGGEGVHVDDDEILNTLENVKAWGEGKWVIPYLPHGLSVEQVTVTRPWDQDSLIAYQAFADIIREALGQTLGSIGLSSNGSRALSETVSDKDDQVFREGLEGFLRNISGFQNKAGCLINKLLASYGFEDLVGTGRVYFDLESETVADILDIDNLIKLVQAGVLDLSDLQEGETKVKIYNAVGLTYEVPETTIEDEEAEGPNATTQIEDLASYEPLSAPEDVRLAIEQALAEDGGSQLVRSLGRRLLAEPDKDDLDEVLRVAKNYRNGSERSAHNYRLVGGDAGVDWAGKELRVLVNNETLNDTASLAIPKKYKEERFTPPAADKKEER